MLIKLHTILAERRKPIVGIGVTDLVPVLAHLFVKVPRPGDSEGTFSVFKPSCHLLLPV